jgi:hypothetical protein
MSLTHTFSSNFLEWLACVITIWLEHLHGAVPTLGNTLAISDNTFTCIAHKLADCCIGVNMTIHSQNIKGKKNLIADALS